MVLFIQFFLLNGTHCNDAYAKLFSLALEGYVKHWCHTLQYSSIHSFERLVKELHEAFDKYNYHDIYKRINYLSVKPKESLEYFLSWFLHLCYEFYEEDMDWDFMSEKFQCLVLVSLKQFVSDSPNDFSLLTFRDCEEPPFQEE